MKNRRSAATTVREFEREIVLPEESGGGGRAGGPGGAGDHAASATGDGGRLTVTCVSRLS